MQRQPKKIYLILFCCLYQVQGCSKDNPKQLQSCPTLSSSKLASHSCLTFFHCLQFLLILSDIYCMVIPLFFFHWSAISWSTPFLLFMFLISSYSVHLLVQPHISIGHLNAYPNKYFNSTAAICTEADKYMPCAASILELELPFSQREMEIAEAI